MRHQLLKLTKSNSTKAERAFAEVCKRLRIPFRAKVRIANHEVDFIIGNFAIELDGHDQNPSKNWKLIDAGYHIVHIPNTEDASELEQIIRQIWDIPNYQQEQNSSPQT